MADIQTLRKNLEQRGFSTSYFSTGKEAADYLNKKIDGKTVGIGGSLTVKQIGLDQLLATHNDIKWHWSGATPQEAATAQVYLSSVNGIAETGEIVNIDGTGNRVASTIFGHEELYLLVGINKIAPDYDAALWRARNVASPKNAQRLGRKTPCAVNGDRCYDCKSPERICRALAVLWEKPNGIGRAEVVLVGEELGL
jgi:L-lactate utilization protein LutB